MIRNANKRKKEEVKDRVYVEVAYIVAYHVKSN